MTNPFNTIWQPASPTTGWWAHVEMPNYPPVMAATATIPGTVAVVTFTGIEATKMLAHAGPVSPAVVWVIPPPVLHATASMPVPTLLYIVAPPVMSATAAMPTPLVQPIISPTMRAWAKMPAPAIPLVSPTMTATAAMPTPALLLNADKPHHFNVAITRAATR